MKKQKTYLIIITTLLLLLVVDAEDYISSEFIRSYLGDFLIIPFIYLLFRITTKWSQKISLIVVSVTAVFIEVIQLFKWNRLIENNSETLQLLLGTTFDPFDFVAYAMGTLLIIYTEKRSLWKA